MLVRVSKDKNNPYVMLNKSFLEDATLSLRAKGLLAFCMCKPDQWQFNVNQLTEVLKEGREAIYSTFKELIARGYCVREQTRKEKGVFGKSDYVLSEFSLLEKEEVAGKPYTGKPYTVSSDTAGADAAPIYSNNDISNIEREEASPPTPAQIPKKKKTEKKPKEPKESYRDHVTLAESQYIKLLEKYGPSKLMWMLDHLDMKKAANGYVYASDYHVLLEGNWVHNAYENHINKKPDVKKSNDVNDSLEIETQNRAWFRKVNEKFHLNLFETHEYVQVKNERSQSDKIKFQSPDFKRQVRHELAKRDLKIGDL